MSKKIELSAVVNVIKDCWEEAEREMINEISECFPNANEEFITTFLHGKLCKQFKIKDKNCEFETALVNDIESNLYPVEGEEYSIGLEEHNEGVISYADGFSGTISEIILHDKTTETKSGADIALVISIPSLEHEKSHDSHNVILTTLKKNGLLVQAKMKNVTGWGALTPTQIKLLHENPERLQYFCLLLYRFTDSHRRELATLSWQSCKEKNLEEIKTNLSKDSFKADELIETKSVISKLASGALGTSDEAIIEKEISKKANVTLVIELNWKKGKSPPSSSIFLLSKTESNEYEQDKEFQNITE